VVRDHGAKAEQAREGREEARADAMQVHDVRMQEEARVNER
jgi:hypothetical protein